MNFSLLGFKNSRKSTSIAFSETWNWTCVWRKLGMLEENEMTIKNLQQLSDAELADTLISVSQTVVANASSFGLSAPQAAAMEAAASTFESDLMDWNTARLAAEGASLSKNEGRENALEIFSAYLKMAYANPAVTPATMASIGFSPYSDTRTPLEAFVPRELVAVPYSDGTVRLSWKRGENKYGVTYLVETAEADATSWVLAKTVKKLSATLPGATPGVPRWYRVRAVTAESISEPCFPAGIYIPVPGQGEGLQVA